MDAKARPIPRRWLLGIAAMGVYAFARVAWAAAHSYRPGVHGPAGPGEWLAALSPLPPLILAIAGCWTAADRVPHGAVRRGWQFAGAAYIAWAAGTVARMYFQLVAQRDWPVPSVTDLLWVAGYGLAIAGLLRFLRAPAGRPSAALPLLDIVLTMVGAGVFLWHFVLNEQITQLLRAEAGLVALYWTLLLDLAYLAMAGTLLALLLRAQPGRVRPAVGLLAAGIALRLAADWARAFLLLRGGYYVGHAVEAGWVLGDLLVAGGAFFQLAQPALPAVRELGPLLDSRRARLFTTLQTLLPFASIALIAWLIWQDSAVPDYRRDTSLVGWLAAATLVLAVRQAVAGNDQQRLYALVAAREAELDRLVKQLLRAQEDERRVIAYDLHDGLTQTIISAHLHLETLAALPDPASPQARDELAKGLQRVKSAIDEARRVTSALRPAALDDLGLMPALQRYLADQAAEAGWETEVEDCLQGARLDPAVETSLFRIGQEALTNARKYARTPRVRLALTREGDRLILEVRDWGQGFLAGNALEGREHVGLVSMDERARLLGGVCWVTSRPGEGTVVRAEVPLSRSAVASP